MNTVANVQIGVHHDVASIKVMLYVVGGRRGDARAFQDTGGGLDHLVH